jgi:ATP-dependent exoDNAse (exonuclease V) beta subunit
MKGLVELLPPDARLAKSVAKFLAQHPKGFDLDALGASFANEDIDLPKKYKLTAEMETRWAAIRMLLRKIAEEEACGIFDPYLHIFRSVQALLERHASADDIVLLDQLNSKARSLFEGSGITVEELYYRLAARYEHYLIDEFQDTSRLQWSNLSVLPEEALSHGGTLFYVGDKKQAIYRFRGGDVRLFDDVKGMLEAFPVNETLLDRNWRSQAAIVEWNNAVFSFDNLRRFIRSKEEDEKSRKLRHPVVFSEAEIGKDLSAFRHSKQEPRTGYDKGYVRVEYVDGDKKEDRNSLTRERMTELIRDMQQSFALQDLTILTRKNSEVETVTRWLMEEGWMVNSDRTSDIRLHPLIT